MLVGISGNTILMLMIVAYAIGVITPFIVKRVLKKLFR